MKTDNQYHTPVKGMTIFAAFLLVFLCVILIHVIGFFFKVGFLYSLFKTFVYDTSYVEIKLNTYSYLLSYSVFILIGLRVNNNEVPYFKSAKRLDYLKVIVLGILWNVICIFLIQLLGDNSIGYVKVNQDFSEFFKIKGLFRPLAFIMSIVFLIGTVGHGLLRNYKLMTTMVVVTFFALPYLNPISVVHYMIMNSFLIYIYYYSQSFHLLVIFAVVGSLAEYALAYFYSPSELRYGNIIKNHLTEDSGFYYLFMFVVTSIFAWIIFSFKNSKSKQFWDKTTL